MVVSIRPDYCIALRMIALQELSRQQQDIIDTVVRLEGIASDIKDRSNLKNIAIQNALRYIEQGEGDYDAVVTLLYEAL